MTPGSLAKLGLEILPLNGKVPRTRNGYKDATSDLATIKAWGKMENFGIRGRAFIDVDGPAGEKTLAELEAELGPLPVTAEQRTPHGRHLLFDGELPSTVRALGDGLDTRGPNGYVATGKGYTWTRPPSKGLAELPAAWRERLTGLQKNSAEEPRSTLENLLTNPPAEGERNNWLAKAAGHFARELKYEGAYREVVTGYGREIGLDDDEIAKLARSIWKKEQAKADGATAYSLLSIEELAALKPPSWLIDKHLPESSFSTIYGPPGVGKSFLVLDWALSIAAGERWHIFNVKQCPVLYITSEGVSGLYSRISHGSRPTLRARPTSARCPTL